MKNKKILYQLINKKNNLVICESLSKNYIINVLNDTITNNKFLKKYYNWDSMPEFYINRMDIYEK